MANKNSPIPLEESLPYRLGQMSAELNAAKEKLDVHGRTIESLEKRLSEAEEKVKRLNKWKLGLVIVLILTILVFIFNIPLKDALERLAQYRGL